LETFFAPIEIGIVMGLLLAWSVLAFAIAFRLFGFPDLTIEGSVPIGAAVFAVMIQAGMGLLVSTIAATLAGASCGALTGFLHARFGINKFLAGILVIAVTYSISLRLMGGSNIGLLQAPSLVDAARPLGGLIGLGDRPLRFLVALIVLSAGCLLLLKALGSINGMRIRVAGTNPEYAHALGFSVTSHLIIGLAATNALAALSGALLAGYQGFADVGMGQGFLIIALAAMTIGEKLLPERRLSLPAFVIGSAVVGSIVYNVIIALAVRTGLAATDLKLATALIVMLVIALRFTKNGHLLSDSTRA
jgi:putative tryptophan/tyrosine transport system permease protein